MKTYPDYDYHSDGHFARAETNIRKKDPIDGLWKLIPVVTRHEGKVMESDFLKQFHTICYKVGLFYKFNHNLINPIRPWEKFFNIDDDQRSEKIRMSLKRISPLITVL